MLDILQRMCNQGFRNVNLKSSNCVLEMQHYKAPMLCFRTCKHRRGPTSRLTSLKAKYAFHSSSCYHSYWNTQVAMKPAIVSRWFWPPPPEMDNFKMPGQFARSFPLPLSKIYAQPHLIECRRTLRKGFKSSNQIKNCIGSTKWVR